MTIKDSITAVLSNVKANFAAGAEIYNCLGDNESLKEVFLRKAKRSTQEKRIQDKLEYCLKKILKNLPNEVQTIETSNLQPKIVIQKNTIAPNYIKSSNRIPSDAPAPIHELHQRYILLAREEIQLHSRLFPDLNLSDEKRYEICKQIMNIKSQQDSIWDDIRGWKTSGEIPVVTESGFKEGAKAYKKLMNLRTRPKRLQKQIDNASTATEKAKYKATLEKVKAQIEYIEKQLEAN